MAHKMPEAEIRIDKALVGSLIRSQFPKYADLSISKFANGWDNETYRLGEKMIIRLPRRSVAVPLLLHEQKWLPVISPLLPIAVPNMIHKGMPQEFYPWPWSITPFFSGKTCLESTFTNSNKEAERMAKFITCLHVKAPEDAPVNSSRGIPLSGRREAFEKHVFELKNQIDGPSITRIFEELMAIEQWQEPPVWLHGDLHALNIIVHQGEINAVIDWGDLCSGDPATDLGSAWYLFHKKDREIMKRHLSYDENTWLRGKGWALSYALVCLAYSNDNPKVHKMGSRLLDAVLEDC